MLRFDKRNAFDLTHDRKFTCDFGLLYPFLCEDMIPGSKWFIKTDLVLRLQPMLAPIMHRVDVFTHFWFIPYRLLQDHWEPFITGGQDGKDNTVAPYVVAPSGGWATGSLMDYLGEATGITGLESLAFAPRAYNLVWNDWYRDDTLQNEVALSKGDGLDTTTNLNLLRRAWQKDMFTNALPWPQRGEAVNLPLGTKADVTVFGNGKNLGLTDGAINGLFGKGQESTMTAKKFSSGTNSVNVGTNVSSTSGYDTWFVNDSVKAIGVNTDPRYSGLKGEADLSNATAATINSIRQAFQLQRWFEINAISGARYVSQLLAHFHVNCGDARLQRPTFLGGGRSPIIVSEVVQQSESGTTPQGTMTGHGFTANRSHTVTCYAPEHGLILGLLSVMPKPAYQQGQRRMFAKRSRYDFYWPVFSHLGNQDIKNKEIYAQGPSVVDSNGEIVDEKPFGFTGRYDEYRYIPSTVHGDFKSSLNFWHMGRIFQNLPTLSSQFIECNPAKRPFGVLSTDPCLVQLVNNITAIMPVPKRGTPGYIDHR